MANRICYLSDNKDWWIFEFFKTDDEIKEYMTKVGAVSGANDQQWGLAARNDRLVLDTMDIFDFIPQGEFSKVRHTRMLEAREAAIAGRKVAWNSEDNHFHILNRTPNKGISNLINAMDGVVQCDETEHACIVSGFNASAITKLLRIGGFDIDESALNTMVDYLSGEEKLYCLKRCKNIATPKIYIKSKIGDKDIKPFAHQNIGMSALIEYPFLANFDEMGLGKTFQMIGAATNFIETGICDLGVIICPSSLLYGWKSEIEKYSHLKSVVLEGTKKKRKDIYEDIITNSGKNTQIIIIGFKMFSNDIDCFYEILNRNRVFCAVDESQNIKNPKAQQTQKILEISEKFCRRYIFTGTPVANKPQDIWAQMRFVDSSILGDNYWRFVGRYLIQKEIKKRGKNGKVFSVRIPVGKKNMVELKDKIDAHSLRRLKEDVLDLPEKLYEVRNVFLTGEQLKMYRQINQECVAYFESGDDTEEVTADSELTKLIRLAQIASNPKLIFDNYKDGDSAKLKELDVVVEEILANPKKKIVIFTKYLKNIEYLKNRYSAFRVESDLGDKKITMDFNPAIIMGDGMSSEDKKASENKLQNDPTCRMLIATTQAAQAGFTLTSADTVVYLDKGFSLTEWLQSQDRIHRIGQTGACTIISIVAKNTIDEYIEDSIGGKERIAHFLQGDALKGRELSGGKTDMVRRLKSLNG